ncbi:sensor histidine kinase [Paraburkholderia caballeronis]|uniref:histidine kinase n=1 Tax=Paraburkholderia caballeronis TaxID=416943 RepID=A0A1H7MW28_9BURK|nr:sensor histidine kinase [Paraburkholderia caballeronis]PXW26412.1 signal transduction histidine kinase [Paraburkholderia caballeronis]PXX01959.1 signal transduction histidine kinase [Paraburkholderia caballeronis]RAK01116.1 signal transduction histidine kinase [Paraburkholderia caballeronis]SEB97088.1 Signal transduction histidine kinase [Paraburkholderia caballeronis]SEL14895.1 Signal transduction histidine kinase [Paraburkholderia caballeronis]
MTLSDFIEADLDELIDDWTRYARTLSQTNTHLSEQQLRNSARELLMEIAADMRGEQTDAQQQEKSHGNKLAKDAAFNKVGRGHADDRQAQGFEINALVAEYRALRASVLRRWQQRCELDSSAFQEMIRFNEALDQMVTESVSQFAQRTERIRDLFAGVLAHDLRSPVGAILNSAYVLLHDQNLSPTSIRAGASLQRSAERLKSLIDDLFVFARARLGDTLPVEFTRQDFGRICEGAAEEVRAARPDADIGVQSTGDVAGICDGARINQMFVNLLTNAVQHGRGRVRVDVAGDGNRIIVAVANGGPKIPADALPTLFDPLTRAAPASEQNRASSGVGLGLYICRCIASAHRGTIAVESDDTRTVFSVQIPRAPASTN